MKRTILFAAAALSLTAATAQETVVKTFDAVADTWVRENNPGYSAGGDKATIETKHERNNVKDADGNNVLDSEGKETFYYTHMVGLMGFDFAVPEGMRVKSAQLHIVTERV